MYFPLDLCCDLNPVSLTQCDKVQRIEVQYGFSVSGRSVSHRSAIYIPHSVHRAGHIQKVYLHSARPEALLFSPHVAVELPRMRRVDSNLLLAKLGRVTGT